VDSSQWSRLDNAAKIYPPSTTRNDTKVFRFCCELYETIEPGILQHALDLSLEEFPFYRFIIRRGFFWYYFQRSDLPAEVREEYKAPCAPLYDVNRRNLLFELTFYRKRINLEIYHALSDGIGAVQFLKTIVHQYLLEKYRGAIDAEHSQPSSSASEEQKGRDAFDTYYEKEKTTKPPRLPHAYHIKGERFSESRLGIITGHVSTAAMLKKTRGHKATISEFLTAVFIGAIHEGMKVRDETRPVSIILPVNLRNYFLTQSTRNFFGITNISHNFSAQGKTFEDVLAQVKLSFRDQLQAEKIHGRLNRMVSFEHAPYIKMVPLAVKAPVLKNAAWKARKEDSAVFSNIGKISMPESLVPYIRLFDVFNSALRPQSCVCSFEDTLSMSFSSPFVSSGIQRSFFCTLADMGLDIEIASNLEEQDAALQ
jgi:hypothetical protein